MIAKKTTSFLNALPAEITLTTEFAVYSVDTERITAILTNSMSDKRFILFYGMFYVVKHDGTNWINIPAGGRFQLVSLRLQSGLSRYFTIENRKFRTSTSRDNIPYINGLLPGTYRIKIPGVRLEYREDRPAHEEVSSNLVIWTEFEVR